MKTSVVVPCYNHEKYILQCLDSILQNLIPNLELLICDDCSNDSSVKIITNWIELHAHSFDRIKFIQHQKNAGVAASLNELIAECKGELICPLAGDDYFLAGAITHRRAALELNPSWLGGFNDGMAFGDSGEIYASSLFASCPMNAKNLKEKIAEEVIYNWCEPINLQFWRNTAFKCHGGDFEFNSDIFSEDVDFGLMALSKKAFGYLDKVCYAYRCRSWPQTSIGDPRYKWMDMAFLFGNYANSFDGNLRAHMIHRADYYYSLAINYIDRISEHHKKFSDSIYLYKTNNRFNLINSQNLKKLSISVIIPTLNCREKISAHLDGCKEWLPYVQEVIVVDSYSSDGTYEILKTFLAGYECKFIQTGPGLYKSWNHGVTLATQKYVYFSTIGESITLEGLKKLTEWCENLNLDVVITKPIFRFEAHNLEQNQIFWPIHSLAKTLLKYGEVFCPDPTFLKFLGAVFIPESILGSSASNLYRSKVLQNNPFPENIGSQGDVVWAMNNLPSLRVGISGLSYSTFFWDGDRKSSSREQSLIAAKILNEFSESNVLDLIKDSLFHLKARVEGDLKRSLLEAHTLREDLNRIRAELAVEKSTSVITRVKRLLAFHLGRIRYEVIGRVRHYARLGQYHLGRVRFIIHRGIQEKIDFLLSYEMKHWMQLGIYHHYSPKPLEVEMFPKVRLPKEKWPSLAIVTPSFRQGHFIEKTIRSVVESGYPSLTYAVVDGGSLDDTVSVMKRYEDKIAYAVSEKDDGQADAIVKGFRHVGGEIMAYLNADDVFMPGALLFVGEYFAANPEVDVIYGYRVIIDERGQEVGRWVLPPHCNDSTKRFDYIPQETMFWRRDLYERVGGVNPQMRFAMDWDLILRFISAGAKFRRVPYFLGCFRAHESQKSQTILESVGAEESRRLMIRELGEDEARWNVSKYHRRYRRRAMVTMLLHERGVRW